MCDSDDTGWRLIAGYTPHEIEEMDAMVHRARKERDAEAKPNTGSSAPSRMPR